MTDVYDGNGDYSAYNDDDDYKKPRKGAGCIPGVDAHNGDSSNLEIHLHNVSGADVNQINDKANEYVRDCFAEKNRMDRKFPIAEKLLDCEIEKVQSMGRIPPREQKYADIYREKPLRVSQKVLVPIREHPKFNFVGKLLGPKGNSLRRLQEETLCKMTVLGRNSMRDRAKEEELRASKDPKYAHLNSDLHVEISTIAPPAEAYARIAYAMAELRKYLIPDSNDVIRQEQLRELMDNTVITDDASKSSFRKVTHQQTLNNVSVVSMTGSTAIGVASTSVGSGKNISHHGYSRAQQNQQLNFSKNSATPKQKVLSILEKARTAMEETYGRGYEDQISYEHSSYETYPYGHGSTTHTGHAHAPHIPGGTAIGTSTIGSRGQYDASEYEPDYNRRDYYQNSPDYMGGATTLHTTPNTGLNPNHNRSHVNR